MIDRARAYGLLAAAFSYPDRTVFDDLRSGRFGRAFDIGALRPAETMLVDYQAAWLKAFDRLCPPYEGRFFPPSERAGLLLEIRGFYRHFGLAAAPGGEVEDHLSAEFEFMQVMAHRRLSRRAQHDFLERHLRRWLPLFAAESRRLPLFFRRLAGTAATYVAADRP